jgi:nicotinamidase-related amidase
LTRSLDGNGSIDLVPDIPLQDAAPLNAGSCRFDVHLDVVTDARSGGYSAIVSVAQSARQGPVVFRCDLELVDGSVGLSAVTSDCKIIAERVASKPGRQQLEIVVPDSRDVAGIMVRNFAVTGRPSRVIVERISVDSYATEKLLRICKDRPGRLLRLQVRKQTHEERQESGESITASIDLDTAATATIIIDAWKMLGDRVAVNVSDKLAPTLTALRLSGMAILHAAHDREVHALVQPLAGETEIQGEFHDTNMLASVLSDAGICNLIYLGYFSNMCVLRRSIGMLEMHKRGFNTILVRDASLAKESKDSMVGEWFHRATVHFVELNFGATTTAAEIQAAVAAMPAHST